MTLFFKKFACGGQFDTHKLELTWNSSAIGAYFSKKSPAAGILIPILRLRSIALATTELRCNYKTQVLTLPSQIYCHKSFSDLNKPTPWSSIRNIKLWLIIELISSNFQSTVPIAKFHPRVWKPWNFFTFGDLNNLQEYSPNVET